MDFSRPPDEPSQSPLPYKCSECPRRFATPQGLNTHGWVMHKHFSLERRYIHTTTCLRCNKCYWTVQRLQQHLRYTRRHPDGCLARLVRSMDPLPETADVSCELPDVNAYRFPCIPAPGPEIPPMIPRWERNHQAAIDEWHDQWKSQGFPDTLSGEMQLAVARSRWSF